MEKNLTLKEVPQEMQDRIARMMSRTWEAIGSDCLVDDNGQPDYRKSLPRSHVIELVCDAGYTEMYGNDKEAYKVFDRLSYDDMKKLGKKAFPFGRYGW